MFFFGNRFFSKSKLVIIIYCIQCCIPVTASSNVAIFKCRVYYTIYIAGITNWLTFEHKRWYTAQKKPAINRPWHFCEAFEFRMKSLNPHVWLARRLLTQDEYINTLFAIELLNYHPKNGSNLKLRSSNTLKRRNRWFHVTFTPVAHFILQNILYTICFKSLH
jgi:hypothetical protein